MQSFPEQNERSPLAALHPADLVPAGRRVVGQSCCFKTTPTARGDPLRVSRRAPTLYLRHLANSGAIFSNLTGARNGVVPVECQTGGNGGEKRQRHPSQSLVDMIALMGRQDFVQRTKVLDSQFSPGGPRKQYAPDRWL